MKAVSLSPQSKNLISEAECLLERTKPTFIKK